MMVEVEVSEEMEDKIMIESLRLNLEMLMEDGSILFSEGENEVIELRAAFKLVLDYYGG